MSTLSELDVLLGVRYINSSRTLLFLPDKSSIIPPLNSCVTSSRSPCILEVVPSIRILSSHLFLCCFPYGPRRKMFIVTFPKLGEPCGGLLFRITQCPAHWGRISDFLIAPPSPERRFFHLFPSSVGRNWICLLSFSPQLDFPRMSSSKKTVRLCLTVHKYRVFSNPRTPIRSLCGRES